MKRFLSGIVIAIGVISTIFAQQLLTPEDVVNLRYVRSVALQPQGNFVAYTLRVPRDATEPPGGDYSELWIAEGNSGKTRGFVRKPSSVSNLEWAPDGQFLYFLMHRNSVNPYRQVYKISPTGGEAQLVTTAPRNISLFRISPDGKSIAFVMRSQLPDSIALQRKKGFDFTIEDTWFTWNQLYLWDLQTGTYRLLVADTLHVLEIHWTPDSKQVIFRAARRPFTDDAYMFTDNYLVSVENGRVVQLYDTEGKLHVASQSPDGRYWAWLGATQLHDPYPGSLFLYQKGWKTPKNLLEGFPGTAVWFKWVSPKKIALVTVEKTSTSLYFMDIPSGKLRRQSLPPVIFRSVDFARNGKTVAFAASAPTHPAEGFWGKTLKKVRRITNHNPGLARVALGKQETISWKGPDNLVIYGVLVYPVNYQKGKKYPLQVQVHGGPESASLDGWNTYYSSWVQLLAQRGFFVLLPNYRGSIGRGVAFSMADHWDMMGKEFQDILAGIDTLIARGMVDANRVAIGGGSYGGYTSAWAATRYSHRFKAAIVFAGISNQISKIGTTDTPAENALVHWSKWPYEDLDFVWSRSPLKYAKGSTTYTLIAHGERDRRVPASQAMELYRALKYFGAPVQLVMYPREPHGLREWAHQLDFCRRGLNWYLTHVK